MTNMIEQQRYLFDESYAQKRVQLKNIIQLSSSQLFVSSFDENTHQYIALEDYLLSDKPDWFRAQKALEKILPEEKFQNAKQTELLISDALYTLVPSTLFDETKLETYLSFNHSLENNTQFMYYFDKLENLDLVIVYAVPRGLEFLLKAKLPHYTQYHFTSPLLEAISLQKESSERLNLHIQKNRFDVVYMKEGKLVFLNSFQYESAEDFIYFLLYVMEQLKLDREKTQLLLSGEVEEKSEIYRLLYTYIKEIKFMSRSEGVKFSPVLSALPQHYYFTLFNQHLCG